MSPIGRHHRFVTAAAVALAVTAGAAPATPALAAIPAAAAAESTEQEVLTVPPGTTATSSGPTGYLTYRWDGQAYNCTWTQHKDGVQTQLPGPHFYGRSSGTDIVVRVEDTTLTFIDMSTGQDLVSYDRASLSDGYKVMRYQGTTLVVTVPVAGDRREIHLIDKDDQGRTVDRTVTGAPADAVWGPTESSEPGTFLARYSTTVDGVIQHKLAVVNVASASVVETYDTSSTNEIWPNMALSKTHVVWFERDHYGRPVLAVAQRGTSEVTRSGPVSTSYLGDMAVQIVGDWVVYAKPSGSTTRFSDPLHQVTARSLTDPTETIELLTRASNFTSPTDGGMIVTGGSIEQGEGLYRIARGEDGRPAATLLAATGVATVLTATKEVPFPGGVIDFDRNGGSIQAEWTFNRPAVDLRMEIVHDATGSTWTDLESYSGQTGPQPYTFTWKGSYGWASDSKTPFPAYGGAHTWKLTAKPLNGIGPDLVRTGTFTVTRAPHPRDFNNNGRPDLLARNYDGRLTAYDGSLSSVNSQFSIHHWPLGDGWNTYDQIITPGNIGGAPNADVITRDKTGTAWLQLGTGNLKTPFASRIRIDTGWQDYNLITAGSDLTGDGKVDLVAVDKAGGHWLYKGTGSWSKPFAPRQKMGSGWGVYNKIVATGNIGGGPAGDLIARDKAGVLWLHLGKGDGTFAPRLSLGPGWNPYEAIIATGDLNKDGRSDIAAYDFEGGRSQSLYVYDGTGSWNAPFAQRRALTNWLYSTGFPEDETLVSAESVY